MADHNDEFYTVRGYTMQNQDNKRLTSGMEDYLEMIFRLCGEKGYTRMNDLAGALNVQPPSAHKMVKKLAKDNYLNYEKYGLIHLTPTGWELGKELLARHQTLEKFLRLIGVSANILEDTEKIEHNISKETLECIFCFVGYAEENPHWINAFQSYKQNKQP
ncbi:MAG: transcriptional regulator MntR [Bacillota bacterium]|jgi:DtxR family Mn-dependent transcriptional regulator|nr:transcriptional regulator MntR [Clostridia bacterium]